MKTNGQENTTEKSSGIFERRGEGVAGPSREVSGRDAAASGSDKAGQETPHVVPRDTAKKSTHTAPRLVERKTELRGLGIGARRQPKSTIRRHTEQDLYCPDPEVTYVRTERAIRDLVCTLMERQDRMNEEIFLRLNDLQYHDEDFDAWREGEEARVAALEKRGRDS